MAKSRFYILIFLSKLWKMRDWIKTVFLVVPFMLKCIYMKHSLFTMNIASTFYFLVYFSKLGVKYQKDNLWYTCPYIKYHILLTSISRKRKCGLVFIKNKKNIFSYTSTNKVGQLLTTSSGKNINRRKASQILYIDFSLSTQ